MMKRIPGPHIAGIAATLTYGLLLLLAWLPMVIPPANALEGIGLLILTLPTSMILSSIADSISIAVASCDAATGVHMAILAFSVALHAAVLYFAAWGLTSVIMKRRKPKPES